MSFFFSRDVSSYSSCGLVFFFFAENVPPAQLKKLLNKQKKARRKAELEKAQAIAAQEKREHKNKQVPANNEENESQPQDELIPEKLERVSIRDFFYLDLPRIDEVCNLSSFERSGLPAST